jgi:hypothetical protein
MKKMLKYASAATFGLLILSILSSTVMAAATDYLPKEEDLVGYKLIYEGDETVADPFGTTTEVSIGVQLWYRNESDTLKGVIGAIVIEIKDNPLMNKLSNLEKDVIAMSMPTLDMTGVETYWDFFVVLMVSTAPANFVDVTETIGTTESSLAIIGMGAYMIISVDTDYLIVTFGFTLNASWIEESIPAIQAAMDGFLASLTVITGSFGPFLEGASVSLPTASEVPSQTPDTEVNDFTTEMGSFYESGIPGYSGLIILGLVGAFVIYFAKKKVTIQ